MQPVNQQKALIVVSVLAVVVLLATTFFSNPQYLFNVSEEEKQAIKQHQESIKSAYRYPPESNVDQEASEAVWRQIFSVSDIDAEIIREIGADKRYSPPRLSETDLLSTDDGTEKAVVEYSKKLLGAVNKFQASSAPLLNESWGDGADPSSVYALAQITKETLSEVRDLPVPAPARTLHLAVLKGLAPYNELVRDQDLATRNLLPRGSRWTKTTNTYLAMQDSVAEMKTGVVAIQNYFGKDLVLNQDAESNFAVKTAHAFLPGTGVPVNVTSDLPAWWELLMRDMIGIAVSDFVKDTVSKYVKKTQSQFLVTNYLYYSDALVNSKYSNDWLKKYVSNQKDRDIIKELLPQFSCGNVNEEDVRKQLRDKALEYLGYDPKKIDPTDPNFYTLLLKASNPNSTSAAISEEGALLFNQSMATVVQAEAKRSAQLELLAPGKKVPVTNELDPKIAKALSDIDAEIRSALNSIFGIVEPASATTGGYGFGAYVINAVKSVIKLFGISNAVVLNEQKICVKTPVFAGVVPPEMGGDGSAAGLLDCFKDPNACADKYGTPNDGGKSTGSGG